MPGWPVESGGAGLDPVCCRILELELARHRVPMITAGTTDLVWKAVDRFARPDLRDELQPEVAVGAVRFCLGYTEPDGGSDVAAARVRAVRDGDDWVLTGSKTFTTGAHHCQYTFLIARTDPEAPKHRGITMFLVPLDTPGIEIQGIRTFGGERTNAVFYDDARISDRYRLGEIDGGWTVLKGPLDDEHSVDAAGGGGLRRYSVGHLFLQVLEPAFDAVCAWARTVRPDGTSPADDPAVVTRLARIAVEMECGWLTPGPMGRVKGSEVLIDAAAGLVDLLGPLGLLAPGTDAAPGDGAAEHAHRFAQGTATYAGTVEVFRTIIAEHVLGLPRPVYPGSKAFLPAGRRKQ